MPLSTTAFLSPLSFGQRSGATHARGVTPIRQRRPPSKLHFCATKRVPQYWTCSNSSSPSDSDNDQTSDKSSKDNEESREPHEIPQSTIDWNKSWADFQATGSRSGAPPGREPLSKQEVARKKVSKSIRSVTNTLPSRQQLFADWRFWLTIIIALSFFTAFIQSTSTPSVNTI